MYVRQHHRHHKPVAGHKFSIGCEADGELVGVIIAGRPVSWYLDDGFTLEVTRLCTNGENTTDIDIFETVDIFIKIISTHFLF